MEFDDKNKVQDRPCDQKDGGEKWSYFLDGMNNGLMLNMNGQEKGNIRTDHNDGIKMKQNGQAKECAHGNKFGRRELLRSIN